jgi:long-chain acyl-CoA synthetase
MNRSTHPNSFCADDSLKAMKNLGELLSASAARNSQQVAIAFENSSISYECLEQATTCLAQWFLQQGCKAGDRIAFYWPNAIETAELYFACFKAGLIAVPVNVLMKAQEVAYVLEHSKAVMCFARPDLAQLAIEAGRNCASLRAIHTAVENLNKGELEVQLPEVKLSDPALILYTSGTTAQAKGVTHTHGTLLANVRVGRNSVPDLERFVAAFVALRDGCVASEDELREHARRLLADLKAPEKILFLERLPQGLSGKIQRAALRQLQLAA